MSGFDISLLFLGILVFFTYLILMFSSSLLQVPIVGDTTMAKMCSARPGGPLLTVLVENLKFIVSTMIIVVLSIWGEYMWEGVTFWYPIPSLYTYTILIAALFSHKSCKRRK